MVATAGLVERLVNEGAQPPATSDMVTLLGRGVRDGTSVVLPDSGGQWAQNFDRPVLVVEVTGPSADDVAARLSAAVGEVEWTLERIQVEEGVRPRDRITTSMVPAEPRVRVEQGHRGAALGMTLLLGLLLTAVSAVSVDRLARTRPWRH